MWRGCLHLHIWRRHYLFRSRASANEWVPGTHFITNAVLSEWHQMSSCVGDQTKHNMSLVAGHGLYFPAWRGYNILNWHRPKRTVLRLLQACCSIFRIILKLSVRHRFAINELVVRWYADNLRSMMQHLPLCNYRSTISSIINAQAAVCYVDILAPHIPRLDSRAPQLTTILGACKAKVLNHVYNFSESTHASVLKKTNILNWIRGKMFPIK